MGWLRDLPAELFVMAAIGLVMGLLGPFGTFALPIATRIGIWLLFAFAGFACFRPVIAAGRALAAQAPVPLIVAITVACAVASVPVTAMVAWISGGMHAGVPDPGVLAGVYPSVLLVGVIATAIQFLLFGREDTAAAAVDRAPAPSSAATPIPAAAPQLPRSEATPPPGAPFLDRLPPALGRDLLCLEMEDHYVRAHTALGSTLLLLRMRDATAELGGMEGERVHRSWWVARAAIAHSHQRDRATMLHLTNGLDVPVARNSVPLLRSRGWL